MRMVVSGNLEVFRRAFSAIFHEVVFDHLILVEGGESGTLDRGDMDEHVLVSLHRLDEPITLGRVEPLDGAFLHRLSPSLDVKKTRPRYHACHATNGLPEVCSISWSRNAQSNGLDPIVPGIATRNLRVSKPRRRSEKAAVQPYPLGKSRYPSLGQRKFV